MRSLSPVVIFAIVLVPSSLVRSAPPNILLLLADDMTYTDLGCYGNTDVKTPHLDELAQQGLQLNACFNSAPMCAPTRMSLYTGIHPVRNGAHPNHSRVYDHIRSIPHYLRPLGYTVAHMGKTHHKPKANFPFENLGGRHHDNGKGVDLEIDNAVSFMKSHRGKPWCLVMASNQPHTPWNRGNASDYDPNELSLPAYFVDTSQTRKALCAYYAEITYMDQQMGQVLQALKESGQEKNTLVIFLSEQGSNFPHCKWTCYDTGLRSAGLIRWPGVVTAGMRTDAIVQYVDVLPTVIEAGGGDPHRFDFDGRSFLALLQGKAKDHHRYAFGIQTSKGIYSGPEAYGIRTVRDERYRLIWNLNWEQEFKNSVTKGFPPYLSWQQKAATGDGFAQTQYQRYKKRPQYELYDLQQDPFELKNLADDAEQQVTVARLKQELDAWMKQQGDRGAETEALALTRVKKSH